MNKRIALILALLTLLSCVMPVLAEEAPAAVSAEEAPAALEDGTYLATFNTDSHMFRLNETCDGKGTLTVKDGVMTIHITLLSKSFQHAYAGPLEDAQKEGAALIEPTLDEVLYPDGLTETVHGFDIPVPALGEDFVISVVGKKGKWYNHTVSVTDPEPIVE